VSDRPLGRRKAERPTAKFGPLRSGTETGWSPASVIDEATDKQVHRSPNRLGTLTLAWDDATSALADLSGS
jgi:hypothetical protein